MKQIFTLVALCLFSLTTSYAAIYMQSDGKGNISYSDIPSENATTVSVNGSSGTISTQSTASSSSEKKEELTVKNDDKAFAYTSFAIVSPTDQETIPNQPVIPISFKVEPTLRDGDKIQLVLDGKLYGDPAASTNLSINILERGQHQISAIILDAKQVVLKESNTITIFIHRNSLITSPAK